MDTRTFPASTSAQDSAKKTRGRTMVAVGVAAALVANAGFYTAASLERIVRFPLGHDQAWGLYAAEQTMRGVALDGPHLLEVNPPFVIWMLSQPVHLAHLFHLTLKTGFDAWLIAVLLLCILWSVSLFRRLYPGNTIALWSFVSILAFLAGPRVPPPDLGQREHLLVFLLAPYLLAAAMRLRGQRIALPEGLGIGLFAGIACCLKPQHVLEVILVEALLLASLRNIRKYLSPIPLVCAAFIGGYLAAVILITPTYVHDIVPLLTATYWGFNTSYQAVLMTVRAIIVLLVLGIAVAALLRRTLRMQALLAVYGAASLAALAAYVQQHKGWYYQGLCFEMFTALFVVILLADLLSSRLPPVPEHPGFRTVGMLLVAAVSFVPLLKHPPPSRPDRIKDAVAEVFRDYPEGTPVGYLSIDPWQFPAITDQHKIYASRYMHLWLLPSLVRSEDPEDPEHGKHLTPVELQRLSHLLRTTVAEDLAYWKPPVVAVDPCGLNKICKPLSREPYGTMLGWFQVEPAFQQQWSHYRLQRTLNGLDIYTRVSE